MISPEISIHGYSVRILVDARYHSLIDITESITAWLKSKDFRDQQEEWIKEYFTKGS